MFAFFLATAMATHPVVVDNPPFRRSAEHQVLHLDVETLAEAQAIRHAVLTGWSWSPSDDVVIEPMADAKGQRFYCVHLAGQED